MMPAQRTVRGFDFIGTRPVAGATFSTLEKRVLATVQPKNPKAAGEDGSHLLVSRARLHSWMEDQDDGTLAFVERSDGGAISGGCGQATLHGHGWTARPCCLRAMARGSLVPVCM
jgi:hypothetical protein